jgi:uncharacterized protein (TIGR00251 family)
MWFKIQDQKIKIRIIAKPLAKKSALLNISEQGLQIAIHAKPHKGEANKELILFLSKLFQIPKSKIILESGENSKYKQVTMPLTAAIQKIINDPLILRKAVI